jgi:hypothetical protein
VSDEMRQLIIAGVVILAQAYVTEPWKFAVFARFWDVVAVACGYLANMLAGIAMQARLNYFRAVSEEV